MKKAITVYQRLKFFIYSPRVYTVHGVGIESGPCIKLRIADTTATQMGEAAFASLEGSGTIVPHPEDWDSLPLSPVLLTAGVKSWSTFPDAPSLWALSVLKTVFSSHRRGTRGG